MVIITGVVVMTIVYFLLTRLGLGSIFPAQPEYFAMPAVLDETALEIVAELPIPPGNIAVSQSGRIFFNFHPEYNPSPDKIAELDEKSRWHAFPDEEFQNRIISCLSLRIDSFSRLWLLDFAQHGIQGAPKLFAIQLADKREKNLDRLVIEYSFPREVAGFGSFLNDFQVDPSGSFIYIADTSIVAGTPALIVYSVRHETCVATFLSPQFGQLSCLCANLNHTIFTL